MKKTILAGLSVLALSTVALPALALDHSVAKGDQTTLNKQVDPADEQEYQEAVERLNKMFENQRQEIMAEMNQRMEQMHSEMMRAFDVEYRRLRDQRLNR